MRAAVISDTDGSAEFQKVKLEPQNWWVVCLLAFGLYSYAQLNVRAWLAKRKAASVRRGDTVESLTFKISRLQKVNLILKGMITVRHVFWLAHVAIIHWILQKKDVIKPTPGAPPADDTAQDGPVTEFLTAQKEYQDASAA